MADEDGDDPGGEGEQECGQGECGGPGPEPEDEQDATEHLEPGDGECGHDDEVGRGVEVEDFERLDGFGETLRVLEFEKGSEDEQGAQGDADWSHEEDVEYFHGVSTS